MPGFPVLLHLPDLTQIYAYWVGDAIQLSHPVISFSSCLQFFPAAGSFPVNQLFPSGGHIIGTSASASGFQWIFRTDFLQDWLSWSPCSPRDSQECSPKPQSKSINSLILSLFNDPILTSIHDEWKNHSFDYMDLCQQSTVSAFYHPLLFILWHSISSIFELLFINQDWSLVFVAYVFTKNGYFLI